MTKEQLDENVNLINDWISRFISDFINSGKISEFKWNFEFTDDYYDDRWIEISYNHNNGTGLNVKFFNGILNEYPLNKMGFNNKIDLLANWKSIKQAIISKSEKFLRDLEEYNKREAINRKLALESVDNFEL